MRWINERMHGHPLLGTAVAEFANWGVVVFGVLAVGLWMLARPYGDDRYKRACACGLAAGAVGLLINQVIIYFWHRPRPYQAHAQIVPFLARSHDASFPSDHASAAFGIAFAVFFVARKAGILFLAYAVLIAVSRVLAGVHYPTDVLAGAAIGLAAATVVVRFYGVLLAPAVRLVGRLTDPVLATLERQRLVRLLVLRPGVRGTVVAVIGIALIGRVAIGLHDHLFDEMELLVLALLAAATAIAVTVARTSYWRSVR